MPHEARACLQDGAAHPYDVPNGAATPAVDWAHAAARGVFADLQGRAGIGDVLGEIEAFDRVDLVVVAAAIIREAVRGALAELSTGSPDPGVGLAGLSTGRA